MVRATSRRRTVAETGFQKRRVSSMRDTRKLKVGWSTWVRWAVVLLVLPNCTFHAVSSGPGDNLKTGPQPRSTAIFCDIETVLPGRHCASETDKAMGIRLAAAA